MKIKVINKTYSEVMALPEPKKEKPKKINLFFRALVKTLSHINLKGNSMNYNEIGMEKLGAKEPALILMNHSSFIDLEIVAHMFSKRPFNIVATTDCFAGPTWWTYIIRSLGCIPTKKFVHDAALIRDMLHVLKNHKNISTVSQFSI